MYEQVPKRVVFFAAIILTFVAVRFAAVRQLDTDGSGRISDPGVVQQLLKRFNVPGVSIAIIKDFKIEWTGAYGVADTATQTPVTADTLFQAASISKPVAAPKIDRLFQRCTSDGWLLFPGGPKFPNSRRVFLAFWYVQRKRVEVYRTSSLAPRRPAD